jgi:hypothetical protein
VKPVFPQHDPLLIILPFLGTVDAVLDSCFTDDEVGIRLTLARILEKNLKEPLA